MPQSKLTQTPTKKKPTQAVLSSYFSSSPSKSSPLRPSQRRQQESTPDDSNAARRAEVDLTVSDDDSDAELWREVEGRPPAKRRKVVSPVKVAPATSLTVVQSPPNNLQNQPESSIAAIRRFRFDPSAAFDASSVPSSPTSGLAEEKSAQARERAKRILLADSNVFARRLEVSNVAGSREGSPSSDEKEDEPKADVPAAKKEIDFEEFMAHIGKGKGRGRGKAKAKAPAASQRMAAVQKEKAEVGPSGKTYTPLELQVRWTASLVALVIDHHVVKVLELKKRHPDTLLMFEVGYKDYFYGEDAQVTPPLS